MQLNAGNGSQLGPQPENKTGVKYILGQLVKFEYLYITCQKICLTPHLPTPIQPSFLFHLSTLYSESIIQLVCDGARHQYPVKIPQFLKNENHTFAAVHQETHTSQFTAALLGKWKPPTRPLPVGWVNGAAYDEGK